MPPPSDFHVADRRGPLIALLLAATLALAACSRPAPPAAREPARPVLVATVQPTPLGGLSFAGEVRARERAELGFAVPGVVREVLVDVGATVGRGQVLARLDAAPLQAQLALNDAEGRRLQVLLADAQRRELRLQAARDSGAASEAEWTAVQAEVQAAREAVAAAQAQRAAATWHRGQTEMRAPFAGRVTLRQLEVGQTVGAGAAVIGMEGRGRELWLTVPAALPLATGQTLVMKGPSGTGDARVRQLSARLEAGGSRRALLSVPEAWPSGEVVSVALWPADPGAAAMRVPLRAVQLDIAHPGQGHVLRLPAGGQVPERVAVTLGGVQGDQVEVLKGLRAGEQVVLAGGQALAEGQPVTPVTRLR